MSSNITAEFIQNIISDKIKESNVLEYKSYFFERGKLNDIGSSAINDLIKIISSFSNASGGRIIIGIREDNNHNPAEIIDTGVNKTNFEEWEQSLRNKITTSTNPNIYGIEIELVEIEQDKNCIVITVPDSVLKPHAIYNGTKDEFYIRNGNVTNPMRYNDLKSTFHQFEFKQEAITRFINDRLSLILNGYPDETFITDSSLVLHIIPEWSLNRSNFLDLKLLEKRENFGVLFPPNKYTSQLYNADGILKILGYDSDRNYMSYIQVFTNGRIEVTEARLLNYYENDNDKYVIYEWNVLEKGLVQQIHNYLETLEELKVYGNYYITVTLLNVKGKTVRINWWPEYSKPFIHNIVRTPLVKYGPNDEFEKAMYPILTTLAHACGLSKSYFYDDDNNPIKEMFNFENK
ncbi:ATP-binding protein [Mycoplasma tullyi]|uniref:ATP-binding protein n=1 Tax=Mycoplasma tullyi TaxID=1612150 RepID=A0A7D7U8L0_9MOLU|nr:ATP-binding protein [Mycoplasma tullyi]QMT98304.1 ATP-binding protein [Mycoplasma tullyi]